MSISSNAGVTGGGGGGFVLVVWGFFTFPLRPFKNSSLDIAGMETFKVRPHSLHKFKTVLETSYGDVPSAFTKMKVTSNKKQN